VGRSYEAVIRVNSQSGKGGIAYLLESEFGLELPRRLQIEFSRLVQSLMDASGKELTAQDLYQMFEREYGLGRLAAPRHTVLGEKEGPGGRIVTLAADIDVWGRTWAVQGSGTGPIDAFVQALSQATGRSLRVLDYHEHAIGSGADAQAVAYIELRVAQETLFGVGQDVDIVSASFKAIVSGLQRSQSMRSEEAALDTAR
jgi:2-isopropylmalate synthase